MLLHLRNDGKLIVIAIVLLFWITNGTVNSVKLGIYWQKKIINGCRNWQTHAYKRTADHKLKLLFSMDLLILILIW